MRAASRAWTHLWWIACCHEGPDKTPRSSKKSSLVLTAIVKSTRTRSGWPAYLNSRRGIPCRWWTHSSWARVSLSRDPTWSPTQVTTHSLKILYLGVSLDWLTRLSLRQWAHWRHNKFYMSSCSSRRTITRNLFPAGDSHTGIPKRRTTWVKRSSISGLGSR